MTTEARPTIEVAGGAGSTPKAQPVVVGIYGLPGVGKTFLLNHLREQLGSIQFTFHEGSEVIASCTPGGLTAFRSMAEEQKVHWRQCAIDKIGKEAAEDGKIAVVTGHFSFWTEGVEIPLPIYTTNDLKTFSHILYLQAPAEIIARHRVEDSKRNRPPITAERIQKWQQVEIADLRRLCHENNILYSVLTLTRSTFTSQALSHLENIRDHGEELNLRCVEDTLDQIVSTSGGGDQLETMLVMDADRTLVAEDTGALFWQIVAESKMSAPGVGADPLKALFSSPMGYSYAAFRQMALLYEEAVSEEEFITICEAVASRVTVHKEFVSLLKRVAQHNHVAAIVVTCGLSCVWEKVLEKEGLSHVAVIGGGRIEDELVVTPSVKATIVERLRDFHHLYVWAFGDSPLDLPMMSEAHQAVVVVGEEYTRSKSMDKELQDYIERKGLHVRQTLLPALASPRLDTTKLPIVQLTDEDFIESVLHHRSSGTLGVLHATQQNAAKLLMAPMRNANVAGPELRRAHGRAGEYLAHGLLTDLIGLEEYAIPHVQGRQVTAHRLRDEDYTLIVALMRGGEPMAFGVNDACPSSMFLHAWKPDEVKAHHLKRKRTVLLVDSVVNTGKSVVEFIQHIRTLSAAIRIVIIAGVVHSQALSKGTLANLVEGDANLGVVALRLSENRFTGRGNTDTGNRLFNTTHLD